MPSRGSVPTPSRCATLVPSRCAVLCAPARARAVARLDPRERAMEAAQTRRRQLRGDVVELERVAREVVVLAFAGDVLDIEAVARPDPLIVWWVGGGPGSR